MKRILLTLIVIASNLVLLAQDAHFSQFYANPMYLAPSFAGSAQGPRFVLNFRDQWPAVPGVYLTYSFSADHYFENYNSGMGVYFFADNAGGGKLVTKNIGYAYSYKVKINSDFYFQPGITAYYYERMANYSSVNFADEFFGDQFVGSTSEVLPESKVQHADFAVSVLGYLKNFWFGTNVDHLMNVSPVIQSDYRYPDMRLSVFGGVKYNIKKTLRSKTSEYLHFAFNYRVQSSIHQLDLGGYYNRNPLVLGLWYRGMPIANEYHNSDAIIYLLGLKYKNYVFSYSYDMTIGKLISRTGGSHEISVIYTFNDAEVRPRKHKPIPCPEF